MGLLYFALMSDGVKISPLPSDFMFFGDTPVAFISAKVCDVCLLAGNACNEINDLQ